MVVEDGGQHVKEAWRTTDPTFGPLRRRPPAGDLGRGAQLRRRRFPLGGGEARSRGFGLFSCSKTTNEVNFLSQKFARAVIGSNNVDSCNRT